MPQGNILTLPAGTYTIGSDFPAANNYACLVVPSNVAGIWGAGPDLTILQMAPSSSTVPSSVWNVPTGDSNPCQLMRRGTGNFVFKQLQLKGTPQGHYYGGLTFYPDAGPSATMTGIVVDSVKFINAAPGFANFPPGETFQMDFNHTDGAQVLNCEMDGRDPNTLVPTSASPLGFNTSTNSYVADTFCHDGVSSMPTWWHCTNVHTLRLRSYHTGSGGGNYSGSGINHEEVGGTILHESPTVQPGYSTTGPHGTRNGLHMSFSNDGSFGAIGTPAITITEPSWDAGPDAGGCLGISVNGVSLAGATVVHNGVHLTAVDAAAVGYANGNPATQFYYYS